jgi:hypothetical protein
MGAPLSGLRNWRPRTPRLPDDLAHLVKPDDPEWFAREMAIAVAPVISISQWGAHEVLQHGNGWGKLRTLLRAIVRRPALRVHVGPPVALADLRMGRVGDANRARYRIAAALTRGLVPLRADERDRPAFVDPTRPTTAVAAYPGGVVPEDIP